MGRPKFTLDFCQSIALTKNGKCLSLSYINKETPMLWECNICTNQWHATLGSIKNCHSWCPKCAIDKNTKRKTEEEKDAHKKQYHRNYYLTNKDKILEQNKEYRIENYESVIATSKKWKQENHEKHKETARLYRRKKIDEDLNFKIADRLRSRIQKAIKNQLKTGSAISDLGCSVEYLKEYLESKFEPGMSWDNWSMYGWHIDHIIPLSSFNMSDPEEFKKASHYTNLQPLWAKDNLRKHSKLSY